MKTEFETFRRLGSYEKGRLEQNEPSCFNGVVEVTKTRVVFEEVEEPVEVIRERIKKLWAECDNHHHWTPLKAAAAKYGLVLNHDDVGKKRKR